MLLYSNSNNVQTATNTIALAEISVGSRYLVNDSELKGAIIQIESYSADVGWYNYFFIFYPDGMPWPARGPHFFSGSDFHSHLEKVDYQLLPGDKVRYFGPKESYGLGDIYPDKGTEGTILSIKGEQNTLNDELYVQVMWPEGTVQPNKQENGQSISWVWSNGLLKKAE